MLKRFNKISIILNIEIGNISRVYFQHTSLKPFLSVKNKILAVNTKNAYAARAKDL